MDPHNHPNRYSLSPDLDDSEEGTNYLRRLKGKPGGSVDKNLATGSRTLTTSKTAADPPAIGAASPFTERRKTPRFSCSGRIEMRVEGADYRMGGTLTDISLHGCYVEMNNTYPVGTKLSLELEVISMRIKLAGVVRAAYPFLGMGISFGQVEASRLAQLQELLVALVARKAYGAVGR